MVVLTVLAAPGVAACGAKDTGSRGAPTATASISQAASPDSSAPVGSMTPSTAPTDSSAASEDDSSVVITATPNGESVDVVALADSTTETVLTTSSNGVTFTIRIPVGALPNDLTFTVTPGVTNDDEPAMLVEPSGLALLKPARLSVSGTFDRLLAWGPTGSARLLPEVNEEDNSTPVVLVGGVAPAHSERQARTAGLPNGDDPINQWAKDEENDESENPDGEIDENRKDETRKRLASGPICKPGDRKSALEALAANRAGTSLGVAPAPPPSCLDVNVKVTVTLAGDVQFPAGTATIEEVMSGKGRLLPSDTGHAGDISLAAQQSFLRKDVCTTNSASDEVMSVESSWPGAGMAQLKLTPKASATLDYNCKGYKAPGIDNMMSGGILRALANLTGGSLTVQAPITEGSFYIFSLLKSTDQVKEWRVAGRDWQSTASGTRAKFTFTVDVAYSVPD